MESASRRTLPGPLLHIIVLLTYYYIGYFKSHVASIVVVMDQIASNFSAMIFIYHPKWFLANFSKSKDFRPYVDQ